jgi:hypothetical protein
VLSATIRDIAIIIIALQSIIIGVLLGVLIWQIWRLVKIVQTELKPIIDDTQATVNTVRGTTEFVSHNVVDPVIRSTATVAKWRTTAALLAGGIGVGRKQRRSTSTNASSSTASSATASSTSSSAASSTASSTASTGTSAAASSAATPGQPT